MKSFLLSSTRFYAQDVLLFIIRVVAGSLMMLQHAMPKLEKWEVLKTEFYAWLGLPAHITASLAIGAELGCAFLLILGCFSRIAAFFLAVTMAVAAFGANYESPLAKKELAIIYLLIFILYVFSGAGRYSLDHFLFNRKSSDSNK